MKHIESMTHLIKEQGWMSLLLLLMLLLNSCKDSVSLDGFNNKGKLVVYCFPTAGDSTRMWVSTSVPVTRQGNHTIEPVNEAQISYNINGKPCPVEKKGKGIYLIKGTQRAGDKVSLHVSFGDYTPITAEVTLPQPVKVELKTLRTIGLYDNDYERTIDYDQLAATFSDNAGTHDFYAVRVCSKYVKGIIRAYKGTTEYDYSSYSLYLAEQQQWDSVSAERIATVYRYPKINTQSEPLLNPLTDIDDFFGFSGDWFDNLCLFDDSGISGKEYTLHLNVEADDNGPSGFQMEHDYSVELYRITPEFYRFINALNDTENNDLGSYGFSPVRPMISNCQGGLGLVGALGMSSSNWLTKTIIINDPHICEE